MKLKPPIAPEKAISTFRWTHGTQKFTFVVQYVNVEAMRLLLQPRVLKQATVAAALSAAACYPRLALWNNRTLPLWYLEAIIFVCGIVLWSFVLAWHTAKTNRPVFLFKVEFKIFIAATVIGVIAAVFMHALLDPMLRAAMPEEFPVDIEHWLASLLFSLALAQLFLVLAPFDLFVRTFNNARVAAVLTALFGAFVLAMKINAISTPMAPLMVAALLLGRAAMTYLAVSFYLRGGIFLLWWWTFLFQARQLPDLSHY